jgi:hypothetical protein
MGETKRFPTCGAELHVGQYGYLCILALGHEGPHGRLVPTPMWWTGDAREAGQ